LFLQCTTTYLADQTPNRGILEAQILQVKIANHQSTQREDVHEPS